MFSIGQLDQRIVICSTETLLDEFNTPMGKQRIFKYRCWAKVSNLHGKEYYEAYGLQIHRELKFTFRFIPGLTENHEIFFNSHYYNITFIDHIKYGKQWIEVRASEINPKSLRGERIPTMDEAWDKVKERSN
ncbi:phage head closure protein [Facklamia languida]